MKSRKPTIFLSIMLISGMLCASLYASSNQEVIEKDSQDTAEIPVRDYIDTHMHLDAEYSAPTSDTDTEGSKKRSRKKRDEKHRSLKNWIKDYDTAAKDLIALMDKKGVRKTVLMPPPQVPKQSLQRDYKDIQNIVEKYPDRFVFLAGGYTLNPLIQASDPDKVSKSLKFRFQKAAEKVVHEGAKGFGEMSALHLSFNPKHPFSEVAPDHPLFLVLSDTAAKYDVPIDLHMEAVEYNIPLPEGFNKMSPNNPVELKENISALERLLIHNRGANIIWQHAGWDNTGHKSPDLIRKLLQKHTNLYIALRVEDRALTLSGKPMPNRITNDKGDINKKWLALFKDFPDQFVIGSDEFIGIPGKTKPKPTSFDSTWTIIEQLPPDVSEKIGKTNAQRLFHIR